MSSTRTNNSFFFLGAAAALVALVAAMAALFIAYDASPARAADSNCTTTAGTTTCTFAFTGSEQTFVVPEGVSTVHVVATGAPGAVGQVRPGASPAPPGLGAVVSGNLTGLTTGGTLYVNVGGAPTGSDNCVPPVHCIGGFNGGGESGNDIGGGGGGASDVRSLSRDRSGSLASRLIVAAGGGGAGFNGMCNQPTSSQPLLGGSGGAGGSDGGDGESCSGPNFTVGGGTGGKAGTQSAGGAGGIPRGQSGSLGQGGLGGGAGGGGGGGGLFGGGGGGSYSDCFTDPCTDSFSGAGGGGGGSNLVPQGGSAILDDSGDPSIAISYKAGGVGEPPPPTEQPQSKEECKKGGYEEFGFKNQGQCIKAVNHPS